MEVPIDAPDALAEWLIAAGHTACASPLPDGFMDTLPMTCLRASGGSRDWPVLDRHRIGVDVYGATIAEALTEARAVFALLDSINAMHPSIGSVQTYGCGFGGSPQESTDPNHPDAPMATFLAELSCRALTTD